MTKNSSAQPRLDDGTRGFIYAMAAYLFWGMLPFYLKAVSHISAFEVVAHRIIWSVPVAFVLLLIVGNLKDVLSALRQPRLMAMALLTASLVTANWTIYIWAVATDQVMASALGYYINPLLNVLLGAVFLGERMNKIQWISVSLAAAAVVLLTIHNGGLPWISLALPLTFGLYGFFRKSLPLGALQGFTLEIIILCVPALGYLLWLMSQGQDHFVTVSANETMLLLAAGPITAIPLIFYAAGAKMLRYTTLGLMQYMTPTILFLLAVFVFDEPFSTAQLAAFALIWVGLAIYTWSSLSEHRRARAERLA